MQTQFRHQQLQTPVLVLERLQPLRLRNFHPAILLLPAIKRRRAYPMLTAQIRRLHTSLALLQDPMICCSLKRLFFIASVLSNNLRENSSFNWERVQGAGQAHGVAIVMLFLEDLCFRPINHGFRRLVK